MVLPLKENQYVSSKRYTGADTWNTMWQILLYSISVHSLIEVGLPFLGGRYFCRLCGSLVSQGSHISTGISYDRIVQWLTNHFLHLGLCRVESDACMQSRGEDRIRGFDFIPYHPCSNKFSQSLIYNVDYDLGGFQKFPLYSIWKKILALFRPRLVRPGLIKTGTLL